MWFLFFFLLFFFFLFINIKFFFSKKKKKKKKNYVVYHFIKRLFEFSKYIINLVYVINFYLYQNKIKSRDIDLHHLLLHPPYSLTVPIRPFTYHKIKQ
jgi:uncharacterized membrane protein